MLPLLIDNFEAKNIVPIFTETALKIQSKVLKDELGNSYDEIFNNEKFNRR